MTTTEIRFDDGGRYEQMMGVWSRIAGHRFLDWLALPEALRWLDVGCGNGAFTEVVAERQNPVSVDGIDPSEAQLAYARSRQRPGASMPSYRAGNAMALPYATGSFDAATMALVIFFVPEPALGVAEMVRVVVPGGWVAAYAWDFPGGGFPLHALQQEAAALGATPAFPPSVNACRLDVMAQLWREAGCTEVETCRIAVERRFDSFEHYWAINEQSPGTIGMLAAMSPGEIATLKDRVEARLDIDGKGRVLATASANAVKGRAAFQ